MTVSLQTHDGQHYLCAEPDGRVVADRRAIGPWEEWTVAEVRPGVVGLRSHHGAFLCGEPDGRVVADRPHLNAWEEWQLVPAGDGVALRSVAHGYFLAAEGGGGGAVGIRRDYDEPGPWETFRPSAPMGFPSAGLPLRVEPNARYFQTDAGRFDWREITAFALLAYYQHGRGEEARAWMREVRALGFTVGRVLCTYTIGRDVIGHAGPDRPGYWEALEALCVDARRLGFRLRLCLFGALEPFGAIWDPQARRGTYVGDVQRRGDAFALELVDRVRAHPNVTLELSNEPVNTGFRGLDDALVSLGRRIRAAWPDAILNLGDVAGMDFAKAFDQAFNAVDRHVDRDPALRMLHSVKRMGEVDFRDLQPRPLVALSGEPYNAGEERRDGISGGSQGAVPYPVTAFAYGAVCRARQILPTFHYDGGLYCTPLQPVTVACAQAFHAALDAFPMLEGERWRGHWGLARGDYWRDVWPDTDDVQAVEEHIVRGRGPWRAFGIGPYSVVFPEPVSWDYRANLDASAERVAYRVDDRFGVGIYRRL